MIKRYEYIEHKLLYKKCNLPDSIFGQNDGAKADYPVNAGEARGRLGNLFKIYFSYPLGWEKSGKYPNGLGSNSGSRKGYWSQLIF